METTFEVGELPLIELHRKRWNPNLRMFYMRHAVFRMTTVLREYGVYAYWHEDNDWIDPFQLERAVFAAQKGGASVFVDNHCGHGSYSDKTCVSDLAGARLLFDGDDRALIHKLRRWYGHAHRLFQIDSAADVLQSESFVQHVLDSANAKVTKIDFHRADVRYLKGHLCATRYQNRVCSVCRAAAAGGTHIALKH